MQALEGIRVLDFSQMMLGPFATQVLGDFGADVIKVERPEGEWERSLELMGDKVDGQSAAFLAMNRNKRSVAVDLKDPLAREALLRLAATCDVVVENFRPGVMQRLGLGYEDFRAVRKDIIFCSGTGWGGNKSAARDNRPGQDLLIQAMSGIAAANGRADLTPVNVATSVVDHATALTLACGILAALVARSIHGVGQRIEVDLYSTAIAMQCQEISAMVNQGREWQRSTSGLGAPWLSAPFGIYEASDASIAIAMAPLELIAKVVGDPSIADLDAWTDRDEARGRLAELIAGRSADEWVDLLTTAGLWSARVRTGKEAVDELRAERSPLLISTLGPGGTPIELVGSPVSMSETPWQLRLSPPAVGQHTTEVFSEVLNEAELRLLIGGRNE